MFDKVLQQIEREPNPKTIRTFFSLIDQELNKELKAASLAQYAKIRSKQDALEGLKTIQCAFRIDPTNASVLDVMAYIFQILGRKEAQEKVRKFRDGLRPAHHGEMGADDGKTLSSGVQPQPAIEIVRTEEAVAQKTRPAPKPVEPPVQATQNFDLDFAVNASEETGHQFTDQKESSLSAPVREVKIDSEPPGGEFQPIPQLELTSFSEDKSNTVRGAPAGTAIASLELANSEPKTMPVAKPAHQLVVIPAEPESEVVAAAPNITFSEASSSRNYNTFVEFIHNNQLDFRLLEYAEGFSDSLLGLIHFVHYLGTTNKIPRHSFQTAIASLRHLVTNDAKNIKCRVRFMELLEDDSKGAR